MQFDTLNYFDEYENYENSFVACQNDGNINGR